MKVEHYIYMITPQVLSVGFQHLTMTTNHIYIYRCIFLFMCIYSDLYVYIVIFVYYFAKSTPLYSIICIYIYHYICKFTYIYI